jgi:polyhydroxyalkanoate synthesis regulator phasin
MAGFGDILQKAVYLGVGLASYAGEKAGDTLLELRQQAQRLADEMVTRGEMTAEEARRFVDDMIGRAQESVEPSVTNPPKPQEPRRIEILDDDVAPETGASSSGTGTSSDRASDVETLRQQMQALQDELNRLRQQ